MKKIILILSILLLTFGCREKPSKKYSIEVLYQNGKTESIHCNDYRYDYLYLHNGCLGSFERCGVQSYKIVYDK